MLTVKSHVFITGELGSESDATTLDSILSKQEDEDGYKAWIHVHTAESIFVAALGQEEGFKAASECRRALYVGKLKGRDWDHKMFYRLDQVLKFLLERQMTFDFGPGAGVPITADVKVGLKWSDKDPLRIFPKPTGVDAPPNLQNWPETKKEERAKTKKPVPTKPDEPGSE